MTWIITEISKIPFGGGVGGSLQGIRFKTQPYMQGNSMQQLNLLNCNQKQGSSTLPKPS